MIRSDITNHTSILVSLQRWWYCFIIIHKFISHYFSLVGACILRAWHGCLLEDSGGVWIRHVIITTIIKYYTNVCVDVVKEDGTINRRALGSIVFSGSVRFVLHTLYTVMFQLSSPDSRL